MASYRTCVGGALIAADRLKQANMSRTRLGQRDPSKTKSDAQAWLKSGPCRSLVNLAESLVWEGSCITAFDAPSRFATQPTVVKNWTLVCRTRLANEI